MCIVGIDVNHMDDVGQTLLNWASAFGTLEMVFFTLSLSLSLSLSLLTPLFPLMLLFFIGGISIREWC